MEKDKDSTTENENLNSINAGSENTDNSAQDDTDKYLAIEQPGVSYTNETDPTTSSDKLNYSDNKSEDTWKEGEDNGKNSDAFNQDNYILDDNVDLDEDQNQSISSDDEDFEETNERY